MQLIQITKAEKKEKENAIVEVGGRRYGKIKNKNFVSSFVKALQTQHSFDNCLTKAEKKEKENAIVEVGGFSNPSKMPCYSWSIPAQKCLTGSKLAKIPGSVCYGCYALKGFYHMPSTKNAMHRRYGKIKNKNFVSSFVKALQGETFFRWFDSGDLQSLAMLENIATIAKLTPNVMHWLPTKENGLVGEYLKKHASFPENLTVRISAPMIDQLSHSKLTGNGSIVVTDFTLAPNGVTTCNAPKQGGKCLECRACWNKNVETIAYLKH